MNGTIAESAAADDLAAAIVRIHQGGAELRTATAAWFTMHGQELALATSLEAVLAGYR